MMLENYGRKILRENCKTFKERYQLEAVIESSAAQLDATMVSRLYKSAIDKSHVVDSWEDSRGDITKFEGYTSMKESLNLVSQLSEKSGVKVPEVMIVEESIRTLEANRDLFVKGFLLENQVVILIYNTIVFACVEATSAIISSYVEFVRGVNQTEFRLIKTGRISAESTIKNLEAFNRANKKGELGKLLNGAVSNRDNFIGTASLSTVAVSMFVIGAALAIIPIIRELIFLFYYSRSRMSDYLEQQALLLEINRKSVEASGLPLKDQKVVLRKQDERAKEFRKLSEKIKFTTNRGASDAHTAMKQESKTWKIDDVQKQMVEDSSNGFQLL